MKPILGVMMILLLAACGGSGGETDGEPRDESQPVLSLQGSSWLLKHVNKTAIPSGVTITAVFADGKVSGRSGCNSYFSTYETSEGTITFGPVGGTKMMCPDEVMKWEREFMAFLEAAVIFHLDDDRLMIFRKDGETLTFEPAKPGS